MKVMMKSTSWRVQPSPNPSRSLTGIMGRLLVERSTERLHELLEGHQLVAAGRGRHQDDRLHAGVVPRLHTLAHPGRGAVERDLAQPAIGHERGDALLLAGGDRLADGP